VSDALDIEKKDATKPSSRASRNFYDRAVNDCSRRMGRQKKSGTPAKIADFQMPIAD